MNNGNYWVKTRNYFTFMLLLPVLFIANAQAASVTFGSSGAINTSEVSITGIRGFNETLAFSEGGRYSMTLEDTGPTMNLLRGILYNSSGSIIELLLNEDTPTVVKGSFDIDKGDYYLLLFAITGSEANMGSFEVTFDLFGGSSVVPLPAPAILVLSALLVMAGFVRRKTKVGVH